MKENVTWYESSREYNPRETKGTKQIDTLR